MPFILMIDLKVWSIVGLRLKLILYLFCFVAIVLTDIQVQTLRYHTRAYELFTYENHRLK